MGIAAMVMGSQAHRPEELTATAVSTVLSAFSSPLVPPSSADHVLNMSAESSSASEKPVACIDDFHSLSIGLETEGKSVKEHEWIMMGVINIGAILEYSRASSVIRRAGGFRGTKEGMHTNSSGIKVMVKRTTTIAEDEETKMDVDDSMNLKLMTAVQASPATSKVDKAASAMADEYPIPFKLAAQLTFAKSSSASDH